MVQAGMHGSKMEGGFVAIPVARLFRAWRACHVAPLRMADFRTWLATHEMVARRSAIGSNRTPNFTVAELARLLGGLSERRVRASLRRLSSAEAILFDPDRIVFPEDPELELDEPMDAIGRGRGDLAIPRRLLRHLVAGKSPALIATALAILLRCLSRRRTGFEGRGRVKSSWIAQVFQLNLRRVKSARSELLQLGWISGEPTDQRAENRWGRVFRIDLAWNGPPGASPTPLPRCPRRAIATPSSHPDPLREKIQNQEPAAPSRTGIPIQNRQEPVPESGNGPSPRLDDIQNRDLVEPGRLLELHRQAVGRGIVSPSESDRLRFVALAEHARVRGLINPPGLFAALLRRHAWSFITQAEEDAARRKLKAHLWGEPKPTSPSSRASHPPTRSDDARIVIEIQRTLTAAGYRGDAFPQLRRIDAGWTRARWDAAIAEIAVDSLRSSARIT